MALNPGISTVAAAPAELVMLKTEQIRGRIRQLALRISTDYHGEVLYAICVEDGFMFMSDLVRELEIPVVCQFIKPEQKETAQPNGEGAEIFFSPEVEVENAQVLLVRGLLDTGITTEFLIRNLLARGAASVKLAALLDRPSARRIALVPDYFGFEIDQRYVFGYGMGAPQLWRSLPYVAIKRPALPSGSEAPKLPPRPPSAGQSKADLAP